MFLAILLTHLYSNSHDPGVVLLRWLVLLCPNCTLAGMDRLSASVCLAYGIIVVVWRMDLSNLCTWFLSTLRCDLNLTRSVLLLLGTVLCLIQYATVAG